MTRRNQIILAGSTVGLAILGIMGLFLPEEEARGVIPRPSAVACMEHGSEHEQSTAGPEPQVRVPQDVSTVAPAEAPTAPEAVGGVPVEPAPTSSDQLRPSSAEGVSTPASSAKRASTLSSRPSASATAQPDGVRLASRRCECSLTAAHLR